MPWVQLDLPFVLSARPVLWKEARPMFPVSSHLDATGFPNVPDPHPATRSNRLDRLGDLPDDPGVPLILDDSKLEDTTRHGREISVAEIDPEEIRIGALVERF